MTLLRDIQDASIDPEVGIGVILRKSKVLSARLGHKLFAQWVDRELDGYAEERDLPPYRVLHVESKGHFFGMFGSGIRFATIPSGSVPKEYRDRVTKALLMQGAPVYEEILRSADKSDLRSAWDANLVALVGSGIYERMTCAEAWQVIPRARIVELVETVRNRVLNFALEIESQLPTGNNSDPDPTAIPNQRVTQIFNTVVMGDKNAIAAGNVSGTVASLSDLNVGDFKALRALLQEHGIEAEDVDDLEVAVEADRANAKSKGIGPKVGEWIGRVVAKAASGALNIPAAVAAQLITGALNRYYGIP